MSGFAGVMGLEFETETNLLWAVCDDTCNGQHETLDIAQSGANAGKFVVTSTYDRPAGMANLNNEGFTITPQAECVVGLKPVFWAEDLLAPHALRAGTLNCTGPPGPDPTPPPGTDPTPAPDTKVDGSVTAKMPQAQKGRKIVVKAAVTAAEALTAEAAGRIKAGKESYALKPLRRTSRPGPPRP